MENRSKNTWLYSILYLVLIPFLISGTLYFSGHITSNDETSVGQLSKSEKHLSKVRMAESIDGANIEVTAEELNDNRQRLLRATVIDSDGVTVCPVYVPPKTAPLPDIDRDKLVNANNDDVIIAILYDNIRDLQLYIEHQRKTSFDAYNTYLDTCK